MEALPGTTLEGLQGTLGAIGLNDILLMLLVVAIAVGSIVFIRFVFKKSKRSTSDFPGDI